MTSTPRKSRPTKAQKAHVEFEEVPGAATPEGAALGVKHLRAKPKSHTNGTGNGHAANGTASQSAHADNAHGKHDRDNMQGSEHRPDSEPTTPRSSNTDTLTETAVARIFEEQERGRRVFEHRSKSWRTYETGIWREDEKQKTRRAVQELCEGLGAQNFQSLRRIKAVEEIASTAPDLAVTSDIFDRDPFLPGTPDGHIDLLTGEAVTPDPLAYISLGTACAPSLKRPERFLRFLDECTTGDSELAAYLQRLFGYCLTADTREQALFFMHGPGGNGKGVLLQATTGLMGGYAHKARIETFKAGADGHPTQFAAMDRKRLVYASETEKESAWAEARIKELTGGDKIRAHFMKRDEFEYQPVLKLIISGNREPRIDNCDDAMRRRFHVIPFDRRFNEATTDMELGRKLQDEWPGILHWMIEGCLQWQASGLMPPKRVKDATDAYFEHQDTFMQWVKQETKVGDGIEDTSDRLYRSWKKFAEDMGERPGPSNKLGQKLKRVEKVKGPIVTTREVDGRSKSVRIYIGIKALMQ